MSSLVSFQAVRPLKGLATIRTHVISGSGVSVHMRGQMLFETSGIDTVVTFQQGVARLFGLFEVLSWP